MARRKTRGVSRCVGVLILCILGARTLLLVVLGTIWTSCLSDVAIES